MNAKKRTSYSQADNDEEVEIRNFEQDIGIYRKNISQVLPKICNKKDLIPFSILEDFILKDFSETFLKLVKNDFFTKEEGGVKYYDARRINLLFFLITKDHLIDNGLMKYNEKANFIFNFVRIEESENLSEPINQNDSSFVSFISDAVAISCEIIVNFYFECKKLKTDGYLIKLKNVQNEISEAIIKNLFKIKNESSEVITFEELRVLLIDQPLPNYIFSSGWIRDYGWDYILNQGGAQNLENKQEENPSEKKI
jgi:hypothetical protein